MDLCGRFGLRSLAYPPAWTLAVGHGGIALGASLLAVRGLLIAPCIRAATPSEVRSRGLERRLEENAWRAGLYGTVCLLVVASSFDRVRLWMHDTHELWRGWSDGEHALERSDVQVYAVYAGLYWHELFAALLLDAPTSDHRALIAHHAVTLVLLEVSWHLSLVRVGISVMILHDVSDVLLCAAKCAKYLRYDLAADVLFGVFALSFFVLRLGFFPAHIVRSIVFEACDHLACAVYRGRCHAYPQFYAWVAPIFFLLALQVYWGWKILAAMHRKLVLGVLEDDRD